MAGLTLGRLDLAALAAVALGVVALPAIVLRANAGNGAEPSTAVAAPRVQVRSAPPLDAAFARPLFVQPLAAVESEALAETGVEASIVSGANGPKLIGIAGRLNRDAVALVRSANGSTRTLRVGESVDGWRLTSLAIDAAFFVRGSERVRASLPES